MYQATKAQNANASTTCKEREALLVMVCSWGSLIRELFFVGIAEVEELQSALEELIDFIFADFVRRKQGAQIEIGEAAIGDAGRQKFAQATRLDGTESANLFEYHAAQRILEDSGIEQFADFGPRAALNQHRAKKAQGIPLEERPAISFWNSHTSPFCRGLPGSICHGITLNEMVGISPRLRLGAAGDGEKTPRGDSWRGIRRIGGGSEIEARTRGSDAD
jgi:hypothetical protein